MVALDRFFRPVRSFSTFNNYTEYFPNHFQQDNATVGLALRIPIFNASQRSRAEEADAGALKAKNRPRPHATRSRRRR